MIKIKRKSNLEKRNSLLLSLITVSVSEYNGIRAELQTTVRNQFFMMNLIIVSVATIVHFVLSNTQDLPIIYLCTSIALPMTLELLSLMFIDQIFRQRRFALFTIEKEIYINNIFKQNKITYNALSWEQWILNNKTKKVNNKALDFIHNKLWLEIYNLQYYIIVLLIMLVLCISIISSWSLLTYILEIKENNGLIGFIKSFYSLINVLSLLSFTIFIITGFMYYKRILYYTKEIENKKDLTPITE